MQHVGVIHDRQGDGHYIVSCEACPFREEGRMSRAEAHRLAYLHTAEPD